MLLAKCLLIMGNSTSLKKVSEMTNKHEETQLTKAYLWFYMLCIFPALVPACVALKFCKEDFGLSEGWCQLVFLAVLFPTAALFEFLLIWNMNYRAYLQTRPCDKPPMTLQKYKRMRKHIANSFPELLHQYPEVPPEEMDVTG